MAGSNYDYMDEVRKYFSLNEDVTPLNVVPSVTGGLGIDNTKQYPILQNTKPVRDKSINYARKYREEEEQSLKENIKAGTINVLTNSTSHGLNSLEDLSTAVGDVAAMDNVESDAAVELYKTYCPTDVRYDETLPIYTSKDKILNLININPVVIIQGPTGCGKTTQVPQYIFDYHAKLGRHCNILVTQPRKIAAISIARRVCEERRWQMGGVVGYQVAMDGKISKDTRIQYVTTGILLQKLVGGRRMDMYTHIILDEIHERDQDTDFAILIVKKLLRTNSRRVKVILMSATIDVSIFAKYFAYPGSGDLASVLEVVCKSKEVTEHYLQELSTLDQSGKLQKQDIGNPTVDPVLYDLVINLLMIFDRIERSEQNVGNEREYAPIRGAVLIFLPGYEEISTMTNKMKPLTVSRKFNVLPLHSTVTVEEQTRVFQPPTDGFRKIIIATNIAESSITVPDIKYVIDFCLTKNLVCDPETNYTSLHLEWASKTNCIQRKGRAGRVDIGRVYRLVTRDFYEDLPDYNIPEIKRCPLTQTILFAKRLDFGEPQALLALAMDPPALCDIENAVLVLKEVGALTTTVDSVISPYDGDLTFVGKVMSHLPLDVRISKLIIYGYVFDCLEDCIIIAASLSLKSFLSKPFHRSMDSYKSTLSWANGTFSDCLAYLNAYKDWKNFSLQGHFRRPGGLREEQWAHQTFIELKRIKEVDMLIKELKKRLENVNIYEPKRNRQKEDSANDILLLKVVIAGAFYPNYFRSVPLDEKEVLKDISNGDPLTTVMVTNLPAKHGVLYYDSLYQMMRICGSQMDIEFDERKAYIRFYRQQASNEASTDIRNSYILPAVYFAVKMRESRMPLELQVFSKDDADRKMEQLMALQQQQYNTSSLKPLASNRMTVQSSCGYKKASMPDIQQTVLEIVITCTIDCGHFWARKADQQTNSLLLLMERFINSSIDTLQPFTRDVVPGMLVLAPYKEGNTPERFYRASVLSVSVETFVEVFFIDYGITKKYEMGKLRQIPEQNYDAYDTEAFAFECYLSELKPSPLKSSAGWSSEANQWFHNQVNGKILFVRVYSVMQNTVRVELVLKNNDGTYTSINNRLKELGYAVDAAESLQSKRNCELRHVASEAAIHGIAQKDSSSEVCFSPKDLDSNTVRKTLHKVRLHGPYSPLEVNFGGVTYIDLLKSIKVNQHSINSVVLNAEPQDQLPQLLVASSISVGQRSNKLALHSTTLMPKIHDLTSLLCLIFAPSAEYRCDLNRNKYTGALCGLGYDPCNGESLYPDHDIEICFESKMKQEDVNLINNIRMAINIILGDENEMANWSKNALQDVQKRLRKKLFELLKRKREPSEQSNFSRNYRWMQVPSKYQLRPDLAQTLNNLKVLPLHDSICLVDSKSNEHEMRKHLLELREKSGRSLKTENIKCDFCNLILDSPRDLLIHLDSNEHKKNEIIWLKPSH